MGEIKIMKKLWLGIFAMYSTAISVVVPVASFWKPGQMENPALWITLWVIAQAYLILLTYVNVFCKKK